MHAHYLQVEPLNPQSLEYKFSMVNGESGDYYNDLGLGVAPAQSPTVYQNTASPFTSQNQIGTAGYSQDMAGYLNALTPQELLGLGDSFNVSGLARSDLSSINPFQSQDPRHPMSRDEQFLAYTPEELHTISKYRDVGNSINPYQSTDVSRRTSSQGPDDSPMYENIDLWGTRNYPSSQDYLYEYGDDGSFNPLAPNTPREMSNFEKLFTTAVKMYAGSAIGAGLGEATGLAGGAGTATSGTEGFGSHLLDSPSFSLTGTPSSTLGNTASLIDGAGSLNLGMGSGLGGAAGAGGAGLGSSASLISGPGSLNLGLDTRYSLPDDLQSLDLSTDWGDIASKGLKVYNQLSGGAQQSGGQPQQTGYGGFGSQSETSPYLETKVNPYQFTPQALPQVQGYSNALKRRM